MPGSGNQKINLVAGLSSVGKSTFIDLQTNVQVGFASRDKDINALPDGVFYHYNTLRYAGKSPENLSAPFSRDPVLTLLSQSNRLIETTYLICSKSELLRRIGQRKWVEQGTGDYPRDLFRTMIEGLDYRSHHLQWLDTLKQISKRVTILHSDNFSFHPISKRRMKKILS